MRLKRGRSAGKVAERKKMSDAQIWTIVVIVIVVYPFVVLRTARLAAAGWFRGKQMFNSNQENENGDETKKEKT